MHIDIAQVPFACLLCNYRNQQKSGLLSHLQKPAHVTRQQVSPTQHAVSMPEKTYEVTMATETKANGEDHLIWRQSKSEQGAALPLETSSSDASTTSEEELSDGLSTPGPFILLGEEFDMPQDTEVMVENS